MLSPPGQAGVTQSPEALVKIRRQREGEFSLGDEVSVFSCPYTFALLVLGNVGVCVSQVCGPGLQASY